MGAVAATLRESGVRDGDSQRLTSAHDWAGYFAQPEGISLIPRPRLRDAVVASPARWCEIVGMAGMGRSTLLAQVLEELSIRHEAWMLIEQTKETTSFAALFASLSEGEPARRRAAGSELRSEVRLVAERITQRMHQQDASRFTVLIDDFDWCVARGQLPLFSQLLCEVPSLRIVTVTLAAIDDGADSAPGGLREQVLFDDLSFTAEDLEALYHDNKEHPAAAFLATPERREELLRVTRGFPLAVGLALDRGVGRDADVLPAFVLDEVLDALRRELPRRYPRSLASGGPLQVLHMLSFLPRVTLRHVLGLFPEADASLTMQLLKIAALDPSKALIAEEFVWSDESWQSFLSWNLFDTATRTRLIRRLEGLGDVTAVFGQHVFAGELRQANRLLERRFLTIYEQAAPEVIAHLLSLPPRLLQRLPYLRVMLTLANPLSEAVDFRSAAQEIGSFAQRKEDDPGVCLLGCAIRAVALSRSGQIGAARQRAHAVLNEIARNASLSSSDDLAVPEARVIALLVSLACGGISEELPAWKRAVGEPLLDRRGASVQRLREALSFREREVVLTEMTQRAAGYRTLILSAEQLQQEVENWAELDRLLLTSPPPSGPALDDQAAAGSFLGSLGVDESSLPRLLVDTADSMARLLVGNVNEATALASRLIPPFAPIVHAAIAMTLARPEDALELLRGVSPSQGARIDAVVHVLSAAALQQLDRTEAAVRTLSAAAGLPDAALVFAAMLLSECQLHSLSALCPWFARVAERARRIGFLGTGRIIPGSRVTESLTVREQEVLQGLADGRNARQISEDFFVSVSTVKTHIRALSKKLGASGREEILRTARRLGLLD